MAQNRLGVTQATVDGKVVDVKGGVEYSLGGDKLTSVMGVDRHHGYKVERIPAYLTMTVTDSSTIKLSDLTRITDSTVVVDLENGKHLKLDHAAYCGEGKVTAEEGEIDFRVECDSDSAEEI